MGVTARLPFGCRTALVPAITSVLAVCFALGTIALAAPTEQTTYSFYQDATITSAGGTFPIQHSGQFFVRDDSAGRVLSCAASSDKPQAVFHRRRDVTSVAGTGTLCGFAVPAKLTIIGPTPRFSEDEVSTYRVRGASAAHQVVVASEEAGVGPSALQRVDGVAFIPGRFDQHVRFEIRMKDRVVQSLVVTMRYCGNEPLNDGFTLTDGRMSAPALDSDGMLVLIVAALPIDNASRCPGGR